MFLTQQQLGLVICFFITLLFDNLKPIHVSLLHGITKRQQHARNHCQSNRKVDYACNGKDDDTRGIFFGIAIRWGMQRDKVSKPNGCQGDEAKIYPINEGPAFQIVCKGSDDKDHGSAYHDTYTSANWTNLGRDSIEAALENKRYKSSNPIVDLLRQRWQHQPGQRYSYESVNHAEDSPRYGAWCHVTISWKKTTSYLRNFQSRGRSHDDPPANLLRRFPGGDKGLCESICRQDQLAAYSHTSPNSTSKSFGPRSDS